MNPIMLRFFDRLYNANTPKLKKVSEGGIHRKVSEIAVDVQSSVSPKAQEYLVGDTFDALENIAIRNNIKIRIAGKGDKLLVNAGAHTGLIEPTGSKESFGNNLLGFVNESIGKTHLKK